MTLATNALNNNFIFLAAIPITGEAVVGLTLGAIRACSISSACVSRATQLGISITATLAANSNSNDKYVVIPVPVPVPVPVSRSTGTLPPPDGDDEFKGPNASLEKNDRIDLSRFNNKARLEGQTIFKDSRTGYMLIKDRAGTNAHGGSYWIKKGNRIATLTQEGKVLRIP